LFFYEIPLHTALKLAPEKTAKWTGFPEEKTEMKQNWKIYCVQSSFYTENFPDPVFWSSKVI